MTYTPFHWYSFIYNTVSSLSRNFICLIPHPKYVEDFICCIPHPKYVKDFICLILHPKYVMCTILFINQLYT